MVPLFRWQQVVKSGLAMTDKSKCSILLDRADLQLTPLDGLIRLALALGVAPMGPHLSERVHRHVLIQVIMAEEKRFNRKGG